jgi:hypothetical protein
MVSIVPDCQRNVDFASVQECALSLRTLPATVKPVKQDHDEGTQQRNQPNDARLKYPLSRGRRFRPKRHNRGHHIHCQKQHYEDDKYG